LRGDEAALDALRALEAELIVVVAYGQILPKAVLEAPSVACINLHASLLPRHRGASPIQAAIRDGDAESGMTVMHISPQLDAGDVILAEATPIRADDTGGSLHDRLAELGAEVLGDALKLLRAGMRPVARAQPDQGVTYAHKLDKAEAMLDLSQPAVELARTVRAFQPWPVAEIVLDGERLRVHQAEALPLQHDAHPGSELAVSAQGLDLACGEGALRLLRVQRAGGKSISIADFLNARRARQ
jgi:methionyl-tRNA formyltransferase